MLFNTTRARALTLRSTQISTTDRTHALNEICSSYPRRPLAVGIELHSTASSGAQRLPMTANSALRHNGSAQQRGEIKRGIHLSVVRETDAEPFRVVAMRPKIRGDVGCLPVSPWSPRRNREIV